jgi:hypothetical protein
MNKLILTYHLPNGEIAKESIWVKPVGAHYQVDNIPFFAPGIAVNDIVSAEEEHGQLHFEELITPSGHSTIQIVMFEMVEKDRITRQIEQFNCSWEGFKRTIAIDIPASLEYKQIKHFLDSESEQEVLDYKEACLSDKHSAEVIE